MRFIPTRPALTGLALALAGGVLTGSTSPTPVSDRVASSSAQASLAAKKTIVFLAGPKDHGRPGNGRHEYEKDLRSLAGFL